ncbi:MAG: dihydrofolate reductase [Opitutales bacterium]|nr:dihydrofolate reductase [Opitutales bacterium]
MSLSAKKPIHIIVACSENRVIGKDGHLPWRIKEDLHYLFETVKDGVVIEGRRVYDEIKKEYPGTRTVVVTRNPELQFPEPILKASSLPEAVEKANSVKGYPTIWIGGGQSLYEEALAIADRLYLTLVHTEVEGDTFFPEWRSEFPKVVSERKSSNGKFDYTFLILERKS